MNDIQQRVRDAKGRAALVARASPQLFSGFSKIASVASAQGTFSAAQRELIAVAIAVSKGCDDCILFHIDAAKRHGAEEKQLVEVLEVAIEMGGGPAVMYGAKALEVMRELTP